MGITDNHRRQTIWRSPYLWDFKVTINKHIKPSDYPLPRFEDIASKLNGCTVFSVIDLKDALPAWGGFLSYDLVAKFDAFFKKALR